jgi:hypothetical protein
VWFYYAVEVLEGSMLPILHRRRNLCCEFTLIGRGVYPLASSGIKASYNSGLKEFARVSELDTTMG